jgi:glycosyltransferase involved in cell wall biosynthesis
MNIVHVVDYIQPKLGYQEYFLAKEHARMGHRVTVLTSDRYGRFPDYRHTVYPLLGERIVGAGQWRCDGFELVRLKSPLEIGSKVWLRGLCPAITACKPDLVICHGIISPCSLQIADLKKRLGFRLIYDDHTLFSVAKKGLVGALFYGLFSFGRILGCADRIIGISDECVEVIVRKYRIPREQVEMIPLGADTELFRSDPQLRQAYRRQLGIGDDEVVITYTGRMTPSKSPHSIITAVSNIKDRLNKKVVLLFVGNMQHSYQSIFEAHRRATPDIARVITSPAVENAGLVGVYSASDMGVWPAEATASTIEALSCALPVICVEAVAERCKNANGIVVRPGDIASLSDAMLKLVNNDALRSIMGRRSRELAEKELSWKVIAERFLQVSQRCDRERKIS